MAVLYRKYRPQTFAEVVGQKSIIKTLQNQISGGTISHAYLFVGSRGVGKTSVARIFAKAVNCKKSEIRNPKSKTMTGDACGECDVCQAIQNGNFIDLIEIDAASNTGVDNVRELIEHVRFSPGVGKYKVFIVDEVHMLSKGAFNALLKTLEEPPKHAIFILATTEIGKVPATIISRTQRFDFKRYALDEIENHLSEISAKENIKLPKEALRLIAEHSQGGLRDSLSLLDKIFTLGSEPVLEEVLQLIGVTDIALSEKLLGFIAENRAGEIPGFMYGLLEKGVDFVVFNRDFLEYLRKILVIKITGQGGITLSEAYLDKAKDIAAVLSENEIIHIMRLFLRSLKEQTSAPSADLPVLLASVEAAARKNAGSLNQNNTVAPSQVKPSAPPPKIEISDSTAKALDNPPAQAMATEDFPPTVAGILLPDIVATRSQAIEKLKDINGPLAHLLKSSPVERIDGARIIVSVRYKFHKQSLEHSKNQETISGILKEIYGYNLGIGAEVAMHLEPEKVPAGGLAEA